MKTGIDLKQFKKYLVKRYGFKCKKYVFGCFTCDAWRLFDDLKDLIQLEKDIRRYEVKNARVINNTIFARAKYEKR